MALVTWRSAQARAGVMASLMEGTLLSSEPLLQCLQQQMTPSSTSCTADQPRCSMPLATYTAAQQRCLHTSQPALAWERFMRNLRQPMPKAKVLNRTDYEVWQASNFDIGIAQQLLAKLEAPAQLQSPRAANRAVRELLARATKMTELALAAEQLQTHLEPDMVLALCMKAISLQDKELARVPQPSSWSHPHSVRTSVTSLLQPLVHRLAHPQQLSQLSTPQLSQLLYCIARGRPEAADVESALAMELTQHDAHRLAMAEPLVLATMLRSAAHLGWHGSQKHAWASIAGALRQHLPHSEPRTKAQVAQALNKARDFDSPLWLTLFNNGSIAPLLQSDPAAWANILFALPPSRTHELHRNLQQVLLSSAKALTSRRTLVHRVPPAALARAMYAMSSAVQATAAQTNHNSTTVSSPSSASDVSESLSDASVLQEAVRLLIKAATEDILRFSLPDLMLVLQGMERSRCMQWASHTSAPLLKLSMGVVQSRGLQTPSCVWPTLQLITLLSKLAGGPLHHITQPLTDRAVKLLSSLPEDEIADLMRVWGSHAPTPAAMQLLVPASVQLLTRCSAPSRGSQHQHVPPQMVGPLLTALITLCSQAHACKATSGHSGSSKEAVKQLVARIADVLHTSAGSQVCGLPTQRKQEVLQALSVDDIALQGHPLVQLLA